MELEFISPPPRRNLLCHPSPSPCYGDKLCESDHSVSRPMSGTVGLLQPPQILLCFIMHNKALQGEWLQTSAAMSMRSSLFWHVTQCWLVVSDVLWQSVTHEDGTNKLFRNIANNQHCGNSQESEYFKHRKMFLHPSLMYYFSKHVVYKFHGLHRYNREFWTLWFFPICLRKIPRCWITVLACNALCRVRRF